MTTMRRTAAILLVGAVGMAVGIGSTALAQGRGHPHGRWSVDVYGTGGIAGKDLALGSSVAGAARDVQAARSQELVDALNSGSIAPPVANPTIQAPTVLSAPIKSPIDTSGYRWAVALLSVLLAFAFAIAFGIAGSRPRTRPAAVA